MSLRPLLLPALSAATLSLALSACQSPATQRYASASDLPATIQALRTSGVAFTGFDAPPGFSANCRGLGALKLEGGLTHASFLRQAFEEEFRHAGALATGAPRVTLTGKVDELQFDTARALMTGGHWMIAITLVSSNGQRFQMHESLAFDSGLLPADACRRTAEAYQRAVQNLVRKTVSSQGFAALLR